MNEDPEFTVDIMRKVLMHRAKYGGVHLHHSDCIHNLAPEEQVAIRGYTTEQWIELFEKLPEQITSDQWECESPLRNGD